MDPFTPPLPTWMDGPLASQKIERFFIFITILSLGQLHEKRLTTEYVLCKFTPWSGSYRVGRQGLSIGFMKQLNHSRAKVLSTTG